jgi:hypothetical protein
MRKALLAPILLLLGAAAPPLAVPPAVLNLRWCGGDLAGADDAVPVTLLSGYGPGGFAVTTRVPEAQAFFTNGMQLAHAFAHKAAIRAFQEARRLDPACAMCAWGEAWASGPTINYGIEPADAAKLAGIVAEAERLAADNPVRERNLIGALKQRYPASNKGGDRAFADAMEKIAAMAPGDDAVQTITADALMVAATDYTEAGMARPVAILETVLKRSPDYAPAIHFYIHATEIAGFPKRAEPFADKLRTIAPAASHLVHMPSHTYYWVGRYADAGTANLRAVELGMENAQRLKLAGPDAVWQLAYHGHNVHFGLGGALMAGDAATALAIARPLVAATPRAGDMGEFRQFILGMGYMALARFAPDELLATAAPGGKNALARATWHYARGEALALKGDVRGVAREAAQLGFKGEGEVRQIATPYFKLARLVLAGRIATLRRRPAEAARLFAQAATIEEAAPLATFSDPPLWWYPPRRDQAAALLAAGDATGALAAADASLKHRPLDPVALTIRADAKAKLGQAAAAADRRLARTGWRGPRLG